MKRNSDQTLNRYFRIFLQFLTLVVLTTDASTIQFGGATLSVPENWGEAIVPVLRLGDVIEPASVDYATTPGTAMAGVDFIAASGVLHFKTGETSGLIRVPIVNDAFAEGAKTFTLALSNPSPGAVLGATTNLRITIADNDLGIQVEKDQYSIGEDAGAVLITVVRGSDEATATTVDYATSDSTASAGRDYTKTAGSLTFAAGEKRKVIAIPIINDAIKEGDKTFRLTLSNPLAPSALGQMKSAMITIKDNDPGILLSQSAYSSSEDAGAALVRIVRGSDAETPAFTVNYATVDGTALAGVDYTGISGALNFAAGETTKNVVIPILNNGMKQADRTFRIVLSVPSAGFVLGAPNSATVRIEDNDSGVGFERSTHSVWRNEKEAKLIVLRGNDGDLLPMSVDYSTADGTALAGRDYELTAGTLRFEHDETVKSITVPLLKDTGVTSARTFKLTLKNPSAGVVLGTSNANVELLNLRATGETRAVERMSDHQMGIKAQGDLKEIAWNGSGHLLRGDRVSGPWQIFTNARSPALNQPMTPSAFYRIKNPRPATLYIPSYEVQRPLPLIILLHGYGGSGAGNEDYMRFAPIADAKSFLYCFPDGAVDKGGARFWNGSEGCCNFYGEQSDDVEYLRGLIETIRGIVAVDPKRISLIGYSNGGFMSYRMAADCSDLIAGIASLAGAAYEPIASSRPTHPVNILQIHGTSDTLVPYNGGTLNTGIGFPANLALFPSAFESVSLWANYNGCSEPITDLAPTLDLDLTSAGADTVVTRFTSAPPGGSLELWTIRNGSHRPTFYNGTTASQFTEKVADWLLAHPKP
jgi:poly(3-hydroxybutyrate) depolymerase